MQRLTRFSGKTARLTIAPFSIVCTIQEAGLVCEADASASASADASCTISPSLLPRLALQDDAAFKQIECSGDAALIEEILFLARNLRWDAAEDLSRVTGDIAAERIVQFAQAKQKQVRDSALNLSQALAEYWTEERPLLAKPQQLATFVREVNGLRDEVELLELRIKTLTPPSASSGQAGS